MQAKYQFRQNFRVESDDLIFDLPFHGHTAPTDGKLITFEHTDDSHAGQYGILRKTVKCKRVECPKDNFVWEDYRKRIPYLENGHLVPDGWWKNGIDRSSKRIDMFQEILKEDLSNVDKSSGINSKEANASLDHIVNNRFSKGMPAWSKEKLHNVLWGMLKSGENLRVYHVIVSVPAWVDWKSKIGQRKVRKDVKKLLNQAGAWGYFVSSHYARIRDKFNDPASPEFLGYERGEDEEGFHFHVVGFGFFVFQRIKEWIDNGWVVVNKGEIKNVPGLISYILHHASVISSKARVRSLSRDPADRVLSIEEYNYQSDLDIDLLSDISSEGVEENPIQDFLNDLNGREDTVSSSINDFKGKSKQMRHEFKIYWFGGCLHESKFKIPKEKTNCPLTDHEIDWHRVKPVDVYKREFVRPSEEWINNRITHFLLARSLGNKDEEDSIGSEIEEILTTGKKVWIEEKINATEYEKYLKRVPRKIELIAKSGFNFSGRGNRNEDFDDLQEIAKREAHRDPMYAWFVLDINDPHIFVRESWCSRFGI
jgi:hypothetical protein